MQPSHQSATTLRPAAPAPSHLSCAAVAQPGAEARAIHPPAPQRRPSLWRAAAIVLSMAICALGVAAQQPTQLADDALNRARRAAARIRSLGARARAYARLAACYDAAGNRPLAERFFRLARTCIVNISDQALRLPAHMAVAEIMLSRPGWRREGAIYLEDCLREVLKLPPQAAARYLCQIARIMAATDPARAVKLLDQALSALDGLRSPAARFLLLADAASAALAAGHAEQAKALASKACALLSTPMPDIFPEELCEAARAMAAISPAQAALAALNLHDAALRPRALLAAFDGAAASAPEAAEAVLKRPGTPAWARSLARAKLAEASAARGDAQAARHLLEEAMSASLERGRDEVRCLCAAALAALGDVDRAKSLAASITDPDLAARAASAIAAAVARSNPAQGAEILTSSPHPLLPDAIEQVYSTFARSDPAAAIASAEKLRSARERFHALIAIHEAVARKQARPSSEKSGGE